jgi:hypothetical protein
MYGQVMAAQVFATPHRVFISALAQVLVFVCNLRPQNHRVFDAAREKFASNPHFMFRLLSLTSYALVDVPRAVFVNCFCDASFAIACHAATVNTWLRTAKHRKTLPCWMETR